MLNLIKLENQSTYSFSTETSSSGETVNVVNSRSAWLSATYTMPQYLSDQAFLYAHNVETGEDIKVCELLRKETNTVASLDSTELVFNKPYTFYIKSVSTSNANKTTYSHQNIQFTPKRALKPLTGLSTAVLASDAILVQCAQESDTIKYKFNLYENAEDLFPKITKTTTLPYAILESTSSYKINSNSTYYVDCQAISLDEETKNSELSIRQAITTASADTLTSLLNSGYYATTLYTSNVNYDLPVWSNTINTRLTKTTELTNLNKATEYTIGIQARVSNSEISDINYYKISTLSLEQLPIPQLTLTTNECNDIEFLCTNLPSILPETITAYVEMGTEITSTVGSDNVITYSILNPATFSVDINTNSFLLSDTPAHMNYRRNETYYIKLQYVANAYSNRYSSSLISSIQTIVTCNKITQPRNIQITSAGTSTNSAVVTFTSESNTNTLSIFNNYDAATSYNSSSPSEDIGKYLVCSYENTKTGCAVYNLTPGRIYYAHIVAVDSDTKEQSCATIKEFILGNILLVTNTSNDSSISGSLPYVVNNINKLYETDAKTIYTVGFASSLDTNTIVLNEPITITAPVTITATNLTGITIDGDGVTSIFKLKHEYGTVTLEGLTLTNGYNPFVKSDSESGIGGAISHQGTAKLVISNCTIMYSTAMCGGAIGSSTYGAITINNSEFNNNTALTYGGCLYCVNRSSVTAIYNINSSYFLSNTAISGSASYTEGNISLNYSGNESENLIYSNSSTSLGTIYHNVIGYAINSTYPFSLIKYSIANNKGDGVYLVTNGESKLKEGNVSDSFKFIQSQTTPYSYISHCTFTGNSGSNLLFSNNQYIPSSEVVEISESSESAAEESAINTNIYSNCVISSCLFNGDNISQNGIIAQNKEEILNTQYPSDMRSTGNVNIYVYDTEAYANKNAGIYVLNSCNAFSKSGTVQLHNNTNAYIYNSEFYENGGSGLIAMDISQASTLVDTIDGKTFNVGTINITTSNSYYNCNNGAGVYIYSNTGCLYGPSSSENTEYNLSTTNFTAYSSFFNNNKYVGVYSDDSNASYTKTAHNISLSASQISNNNGQTCCSSIVGTTCSQYGGGISRSSNGTLKVLNCLVEHNAENTTNIINYGGGIYDIGVGPLYVDSCFITNNNASLLGGGIYRGGYGDTTITNSAIYKNKVYSSTENSSGGGVYYAIKYNSQYIQPTLLITDCTIVENYAKTGGCGIYIAKSIEYSSYVGYAAINNSVIALNDQPSEVAADAIDESIKDYQNNVITSAGDVVAVHTSKTCFIAQDYYGDNTSYFKQTYQIVDLKYSVIGHVEETDVSFGLVINFQKCEDAQTLFATDSYIPNTAITNPTLYNVGEASLSLDYKGESLLSDVRGNARIIKKLDIGAYEVGDILSTPSITAIEPIQITQNKKSVSGAKITFVGVSDADYYNIKVSYANSTVYKYITSTTDAYSYTTSGGSNIVTVIKEFSPATSYDICIQAVSSEESTKDKGNSFWSTPVTVSIPNWLAAPSVSAANSYLTMTDETTIVNPQSFIVTICSPIDANANYYHVQYTSDPNGFDNASAINDFYISATNLQTAECPIVETITQYVNPNLANNITYYIRVRAENTATNLYLPSDWSVSNSVMIDSTSTRITFNADNCYFQPTKVITSTSGTDTTSGSDTGESVLSPTIHLNWSISTDIPNSKLFLYRTTKSGNYAQSSAVDVTGLTEYDDVGTGFGSLNYNTEYYYTIFVGDYALQSTQDITYKSNEININTNINSLSYTWENNLLSFSWTNIIEESTSTLYKTVNGSTTQLLTSTNINSTITYTDYDYVDGEATYFVMLSVENSSGAATVTTDNIVISHTPKTFYYIEDTAGHSGTLSFTNQTCWSLSPNIGASATTDTIETYDNFVINLTAITTVTELTFIVESAAFASNLTVNTAELTNATVTLSSSLSDVYLPHLTLDGNLALSGSTFYVGYGRTNKWNITSSSKITCQSSTKLSTYQSKVSQNSLKLTNSNDALVSNFYITRNEMFGEDTIFQNIGDLHIEGVNSSNITITSTIYCTNVIFANPYESDVVVNLVIENLVVSGNIYYEKGTYGLTLNCVDRINVNMNSTLDQYINMLNVKYVGYGFSLHVAKTPIEDTTSTCHLTLTNIGNSTIDGYVGVPGSNSFSESYSVMSGTATASIGKSILTIDALSSITLSGNLIARGFVSGAPINFEDSNYILRVYGIGSAGSNLPTLDTANNGGIIGLSYSTYLNAEFGSFSNVGSCKCKLYGAPSVDFLYIRQTSSSNVWLFWEANTTVAQYKLQYSTETPNIWLDSNNNGIISNNNTNTVVIDNKSYIQKDITSGTNGTAYHVAVYTPPPSYISSSNMILSYSNPVKKYAWLLPEDFTAAPDTTTAIKLSWTLPSDATAPSYTIQRKSEGEETFTTIGTFDNLTNTYTAETNN